MAREKYKKKPYRHQEWPKMFYHPVDGSYVKCAEESEVPEGFMANIQDTGYIPAPQKSPTKCVNFAVPDKPKAKAGKTAAEKAAEKAAAKKEKADKAAADKAAADKAAADKAAADKAEEPTLESLDMDRKTAMEILDEGEVVYKKNASNNTLAVLVAPLLKE